MAERANYLFRARARARYAVEAVHLLIGERRGTVGGGCIVVTWCLGDCRAREALVSIVTNLHAQTWRKITFSAEDAGYQELGWREGRWLAQDSWCVKCLCGNLLEGYGLVSIGTVFLYHLGRLNMRGHYLQFKEARFCGSNWKNRWVFVNTVTQSRPVS